MKNIFLKVAAFCYFCIAAQHIYIIFAGAPAYRFFGAGEQFAREAERGIIVPAIVTSFIVLIFFLWGLYALSGARVIKRLFLTRTALIVIASILMLRGALPFLAGLFIALDSFVIISSLIVLGIGIIHLLGMQQVWANLEQDSIQVRNVHSRQIVANPKNGQLIDQLSSSNDILWVHERWMPMEFPNGLHVGSSGGHGSIRYDIESYTKGQSITFRFTAPKGFDGWHRLSLDTNNIMTHEIHCQAIGKAMVIWWLIRPIHDAVVKDCLDKAQAFASARAVQPRQWSLWVRFLRVVKKISPREPSTSKNPLDAAAD
jgi:hypothetical protein